MSNLYNKTSKRGKITSFAQLMTQKATQYESQGKKVIKMHIGAPSTGAPEKWMGIIVSTLNFNLLIFSKSIFIFLLEISRKCSFPLLCKTLLAVDANVIGLVTTFLFLKLIIFDERCNPAEQLVTAIA